ncbi:hypothetical protein [Caulobacter sp. DWP3-1-3b2]|uniref:hypothetical protein n=1 Tax=Caulobacter sp. DWP3-1-3b2 TaxID=2804643 RepID=UPI003CF0C2DA
MRLVVLLPVLISVAAPAYAEGARESRYGPSSPRQTTAAVAVTAAAATARYDGPMLGWANKRQAAAFVSTSATPAPVAASTNYQPARAPATPRPAAFTPPAAPLPTSLYAPPTPPASPPPPAARQVAAVNTAGTGARFYSVGREYGLTPDAIPPLGPDSRVLITASEPTPEARDAAPRHGSADWLAAGVNGDDEDDDGDSLKTRKFQ